MTALPNAKREDGLYLMLLSVHGLVRGHDIELGRDADTGGQVTYVVELAKALAADPRVARVDLLTRLVAGPGIHPDYSEIWEPLADKAQIIRIPCGPRRYLYKENLWPYVEEFLRYAACHVRNAGRRPDLIHGHYADAGLIGARLARELNVPFAFTGHSLGREKRRRLLDKGADEAALEPRFKFSKRFAAEEHALRSAAMVVASTRQEVERQYGAYEAARPDRMHVIPPGVDLDRFRPPRRGEPDPPVAAELARFLRDPEKPMILALARPDERKNFRGLVQAYGRDPVLREKANLVVVAGIRDSLGGLKPPERRVLQEFLHLVDDLDLYGRVAYPKRHLPQDVPELYRLAARRRGVFVNPALTEPFGLTLIEAAASGLPVVATNDGGPRDILEHCSNGALVDPMDPSDIARGLKQVLLADERTWRHYAANGVVRAHSLYSWEAHVFSYLEEVERVVAEGVPERAAAATAAADVGRVSDRALAQSAGGAAATHVLTPSPAKPAADPRKKRNIIARMARRPSASEKRKDLG